MVAEINARALQDGEKPLVFDTLVDPYVREIINTANAVNLDVFEGLISKLSDFVAGYFEWISGICFGTSRYFVCENKNYIDI